MDQKDEARNIDLEWENRVLCSDESCIGTIGPDGRCRECGRPYEGELPSGIGEVPDAPLTPSTEDADDSSGDDVEAQAEGNGEDGTDTDDEWERRTLCRDESCIGVIGGDGRCKECGKPY
ncbi:MAG: hypothetical protein P8X96_22285 [Desulfobacteraceae bacterium]